VNDLTVIVKEIREYVEELKLAGKTSKEIRELVVGSMDKTCLTAFQFVMNEIIANPTYGLIFTHSIYESLGGVNSVMIEEGLEPLHLTELKFVNEVLVSALEDYTGESIDTLMEQVDIKKQGGLN
jgi:hypothetical protein